MSGFGNGSVIGKELGPVTLGQIIAMVIATVIGLALFTIIGTGILVILIVAIVIYMLPHVFGANLKVKVGFGAVFAVVALVFGTFFIGPAFIDNNSTLHLNERNGISADISYTDTSVQIQANYTGSEPLIVVMSEVDGIVYKGVYLKNTANYDMDGTNYVEIAINKNKLYSFYIAPSDGSKPITSQSSYATLTGHGFIGDDTDCTLIGTALIIGYTMMLYYLVLGLSTLMRRKIADTRVKMEAAGRLYPQGYGRCTFCGAVVLPGEVNCRKCGAYIDRPDYMKPKKKNYLACSVCGAEISESMTECPKCGAKFDGEESIVVHADGTSDSTEDNITCPGCGKKIPAVSEICPYCGKKFE